MIITPFFFQKGGGTEFGLLPAYFSTYCFPISFRSGIIFYDKKDI